MKVSIPLADNYALADTLDIDPCPFCGSDDTIPWDKDLDLSDEERDPDFSTWVIWCQYCGADGPPTNTPEDAAKRWNERP